MMVPRSVPRWQIALVLVGFPLAYMLNSFAPWSVSLFGAKDRTAFWPFFFAIVILHWLSAAVTLYFTRKAGLSLADFDLRLSSRRAVVIAGKIVAVGLLFVVFRQVVPYGGNRPGWLIFFPLGFWETLFWIPVALTAGVCEELVYRGFGINALQSRGLRLWLAILLSTLSFVFMHGLGGIYGFPVFFLAGLLMAGIYLGRVGGVGPRGLVRPTGRRSLPRVMIIHAIGDMTAILVP